MPTGQVSAVNCFASVYPGSPTSGEFTSANRILVEPTSSVSPSTMYVTLSVKQAAVPLHWGPPGGRLLDQPPDGLPFGKYKYARVGDTAPRARKTTAIEIPGRTA